MPIRCYCGNELVQTVEALRKIYLRAAATKDEGEDHEPFAGSGLEE